MQCPKCNSDTKVKETRGVTRRRECLAVTCHHRFYTEEFAVEKVGIRARGMPVSAGTDASARIAELERENAALHARLSRPMQARQQPKNKPKVGAPARPVAFFTRESLVPNLADVSANAASIRPAWLPTLPPAAIGRMR